MTTTFKKEPKVLRNEDLKLVPAGTECSKCWKKINQGILQDGQNAGMIFNCKDCYLKKESKNEMNALQSRLERTKSSS